MITAKQIGIVALALGALLGTFSFLGWGITHGPAAGAVSNNAQVQNFATWFTDNTGGSNPLLFVGRTQQFQVTDAGNVTAVGLTLSATTTNTSFYYSVGGVNRALERVAFSATSSVPAVIANPWGSLASSTIDQVNCQGTNNLGATEKFDISTTTTAGGYGSSTPALVYAYSVASGAQFTIDWSGVSSSTPSSSQILAINSGGTANGNNPYVLAPSAFVTLRIGTSSPSTYGTYMTGFCNAQLTELN